MDTAEGRRCAVIDLDGLQALLDELVARGWSVVGPRVRDGAVVPAPLTSVEQLPVGWGDEQSPGRYRLRRRDDEALFGFATAVHGAKPVFFPADQLMWRARRRDGGFAVDDEVDGASPYGPPPWALVGVRSCDLQAVAVHDRVLTGRGFQDDRYAEARAGAFVVAVACSDPAGTCFCTSMGGGPHPTEGYDLCLTELTTDSSHRLLVEVGTERGMAVLQAIPHTEAADADRTRATEVDETARERITRRVETDGLRDLLYDHADDALWSAVADRCLSCGSCTAVCPTCFCTTVDDVSDLRDEEPERHRVWDSCFADGFSYLHGGEVRASTAARYRQWTTHKFAAWQDQFGTSGCVGCGRCIAWCPAAIDVTAELASLRDEETRR